MVKSSAPKMAEFGGSVFLSQGFQYKFSIHWLKSDLISARKSVSAQDYPRASELQLVKGSIFDVQHNEQEFFLIQKFRIISVLNLIAVNLRKRGN